MDEVSKDERFSHIGKDPRFRRIPKKEKKVKIDSRFQSMFTDKKFKLKYTVDKRGRPINNTTSENLQKFYELDESAENERARGTDSKAELEKTLKSDAASNESDESASVASSAGGDEKDEEDNQSDNDVPYISEEGPDFARGGGNLVSSSEDEEEEVETLAGDGGLDPDWIDLDKDAPETEEITRRLAICNMNWDRIRAKDIFVLLSSFLPQGGIIHSVVIYPSEFGLQRMAEEVLGPTELKGGDKQSSEEKETKEKRAEEGTAGKVDPEKIRKYQLNRLKYYYAVVECDNKETANKLYEECDGQEYESSSARLDLRFIPDDLTFEQEPKDECRNMPDVAAYKPSVFTTTALCQAKVNLTWDETDHERLKLTMRKWNDDFENEDFSKILASDSSTEDEDSEQDVENTTSGCDKKQEEKLKKYKNLLQSLNQEEGGEKKDVDGEMEITWEPGLKMVTKDILNKREKSAKELTPWEEYKQRKKEKKKQKREEKKAERMKQKGIGTDHNTSAVGNNEATEDAGFDDPFFNDATLEDIDKQTKKKSKQKKKKSQVEELTSEELELQEKEQARLKLLMMDEDDHKNHFSLQDLIEEDTTNKKKTKKKAKEKKEKTDYEDTFTMNLNDERFADIYKSHLFSIDPSAPEFKKTKGMQSLIEEKLRKRERGELVVESAVPESAKRRLDESLAAKDSENEDTFLQQKQSVSSLIQSVKRKTELIHQKKKLKRTR